MNTATGTGSDTTVSLWTGARGWVKTSVVARRLGYSRQRIHQLIEAGTIPARRLGQRGHWMVPSEWLKAEVAKTGAVIRRKPGSDGT